MIPLVVFLFLSLTTPGGASSSSEEESRIAFGELTRDRIVHAMESGKPFSIRLASEPGSAGSERRLIPDYAPASGLLLCFPAYGPSSHTTVDLAARVSNSPPPGNRVTLLVAGEKEEDLARAALLRANAHLEGIRFLRVPFDSIWLRDYGPFFVSSSLGELAVDPLHAFWRPHDEVVTHRISASQLGIPSLQSGLHMAGGNLQADSLGNGFTSSIFLQKNLELDPAYLASQLSELFGLKTLHVLPALPSRIEPTGHLDMWLQLVSNQTVVVSEFPRESDPTAIRVTEAASSYLESLGWAVYRVPARIAVRKDGRKLHLSYTNAVVLNDRIYIPRYGADLISASVDREAREAWIRASGLEVIPVESSELIQHGGALHCIARQMPEKGNHPFNLRILEPGRGDVLLAGEWADLEWAGADPMVSGSGELFARLEGPGGRSRGGAWISLSRKRGGRFGPGLSLPQLRDGTYLLSLAGLAASSEMLASAPVPVRIRNGFSRRSDAGVSRPGIWEAPASDLSLLFSNRIPVGAEGPAGSVHPLLADSDAEGPDEPKLRYRSAKPAYGNYSATIIEFALADAAPSAFEVEIQWEGYGEKAAPVELYVWNYAAGGWGDEKGAIGKDRYLDLRSGLEDFTLRGRLRTRLEHYFGSGRPLSLLILADRPNEAIVHDYVGVRLLY